MILPLVPLVDVVMTLLLEAMAPAASGSRKHCVVSREVCKMIKSFAVQGLL